MRILIFLIIIIHYISRLLYYNQSFFEISSTSGGVIYQNVALKKTLTRLERIQSDSLGFQRYSMFEFPISHSELILVDNTYIR